MSSVVTAQLIHDKRGDVSYFNLLQNFNIGLSLSAMFLVSFWGILAFAFLINKLTERVWFAKSKPVRISKRIRQQSGGEATVGYRHLCSVRASVPVVKRALSYQQYQDQQSGEIKIPKIFDFEAEIQKN